MSSRYLFKTHRIRMRIKRIETKKEFDFYRMQSIKQQQQLNKLAKYDKLRCIYHMHSTHI